MMKNGSILLVEDSEDDVFFMMRAFEKAAIRTSVFVASDGQQAVDYFSGTGKYADRTAFPLPDLVFLDLKLPIKCGMDVLDWVRKQESFRSTVVVILTSSQEPRDIK